MDNDVAIEAFAALAHETRLAIFQLLVREEPHALPAGEISRRLQIVPSTLSSHLGVLKRARLLKSERHRREIHYSSDLSTINRMIGFMLEDCCNGQLENCSEILSFLDRA